MNPIVVVTEPSIEEWQLALSKRGNSVLGWLLTFGGLALVSYELFVTTDMWKIVSTAFTFAVAVYQIGKPDKKIEKLRRWNRERRLRSQFDDAVERDSSAYRNAGTLYTLSHGVSDRDPKARRSRRPDGRTTRAICSRDRSRARVRRNHGVVRRYEAASLQGLRLAAQAGHNLA